jgi:hypothetical protein
MNKRSLLLVAFLVYVAVGYLVTVFLIQRKLDATAVPNGDAISNTMLALYYVTLGLVVYFLVINLTSMVCLVISWRLRDSEAKWAFKRSTLFTIGGTAIFFLYYFNQ